MSTFGLDEPEVARLVSADLWVRIRRFGSMIVALS